MESGENLIMPRDKRLRELARELGEIKTRLKEMEEEIRKEHDKELGELLDAAREDAKRLLDELKGIERTRKLKAKFKKPLH